MNKYIYIWHFQVCSQIAVSYIYYIIMTVLESFSTHVCIFIFKVLFICIFLFFQLEIIENTSAGLFNVELDEIRAHVFEWGPVLYNYTYERAAKNCLFDIVQMYTQTHSHTCIFTCIMLHIVHVFPCSWTFTDSALTVSGKILINTETCGN